MSIAFSKASWAILDFERSSSQWPQEETELHSDFLPWKCWDKERDFWS